ncbi:MAG TPA: 30S ribosomal protein S20 [Deltaproteobacteria bacterium]|nr:MAG: 30S ribosomal protein S20 [Deltaproteobacteria bacterium GWA2_55_82]OGQ63369.1 MAG: 30S ribosomal protein S20 [Deltaproteobacteria bacterium RIFCSPLOWO2_02_FULL_55_12]OIJ73218.1 MAG: 30S ribosomal protein S20 [Deltaproteobacteria bacterium GWC2_55_46]HBG45522.1 30S ribosomal protein S20 [Deltaproteobacteria bacterium]HCY10353.1 30S ribosomal protein S20 [Deltaproteobacteria bacterium]
MANHASAIKRHKQSEKRRERNTSVKSTVRTAVKKVKDAVAAGKADEAKTSLSNAVSELGKAASKGVIHRNNASRKAARLSKLVNEKAK